LFFVTFWSAALFRRFCFLIVALWRAETRVTALQQLPPGEKRKNQSGGIAPHSKGVFSRRLSSVLVNWSGTNDSSGHLIPGGFGSSYN
jgi:hypothetical protein